LIEIADLSVGYGKARALENVSLRVESGEIVALLGANGAGKSTLIKAVAGSLAKQGGRILLDGEDVTACGPAAMARRGLATVAEGRRLFGPLSVSDNLRLGAFARGVSARKLADEITQIYATFPRLRERANQSAATLSGGEQQMLAIGRALLAKPKIILMDEPSIGLAPIFVREIFRVIRTLGAQGTTILLAEQNARMALQVARRAYVLQLGRVTMTGDARALLTDPRVQELYLAP
jgi:branched-chain amino acid transport system ATP-binding protein